MNIKILQKQGKSGKEGLKKYADIGALMTGKVCLKEKNFEEFCSILVETLDKWTEELNIDRLGEYGVSTEELDNVVENTGLRNNPVNLNKENIKKLLLNRI